MPQGYSSCSACLFWPSRWAPFQNITITSLSTDSSFSPPSVGCTGRHVCHPWCVLIRVCGPGCLPSADSAGTVHLDLVTGTAWCTLYYTITSLPLPSPLPQVVNLWLSLMGLSSGRDPLFAYVLASWGNNVQ